VISGGGDNSFIPIHQKERSLPRDLAGRCPVSPQCIRKLVNPLGTMLLQAIIGAHLEALEDFSIGSLDLSITLWMSNRRIADLDAKILTISLEHTTGELGPVVGDDPV
jgi:hypothetical protein